MSTKSSYFYYSIDCKCCDATIWYVHIYNEHMDDKCYIEITYPEIRIRIPHIFGIIIRRIK
jgi:hypothetical protein